MNANLLHKWRRKAGVVLVKEASRGARNGDAKSELPAAIEDIKQADNVEIAAGGFVALALPQPLPVEVPKPATAMAMAASDIRIELRCLDDDCLLIKADVGTDHVAGHNEELGRVRLAANDRSAGGEGQRWVGRVSAPA